MDKTDTLHQYDEWHKKYNNELFKSDDLKLMIWHKTVLEYLRKHHFLDRKILDVGCGNGNFSNYLSVNHNVNVTGIDFSPESVKIASTKKELFNAKTSAFLVGDAQNLPFKDEEFDLIISCECLEHVPNPQRMIDELYRVVKKDGIVILTTENYSNAYAYYISYLKLIGKRFDSGSSVQPIEHFFVFWRVKKKFKKAGFKKLQTLSKEYVLLLLPGVSPAKFTIKETKSYLLKLLLKPFGRRFTFIAEK